MKIGILDDDLTTLKMIEQAFKANMSLLENTPECHFFTSGFDLLAAVKNEAFDCLILDRQLPDMNGDVILQWVRQYSVPKFGRYISVIMLTNLRTEADELYGLQAGADDYLTKPFKPAVLVQRVQRLYSMSQAVKQATILSDKTKTTSAITTQEPPPSPEIFKQAGYTFHSFERTVSLPSGETVLLSRIEFDLGLHFFKNAGIKLTRESIIKDVWQKKAGTTRALNTHIHHLRSKLKLTMVHGYDLCTIYGFGYCLQIVNEQ